MAETVRADFSQLQRLLDDLATATGDVSRVMPALAEVLVGQVQEVFDKEGAVGGRPKWPDLADSTKANRRPKQRRRKGQKRRKSKPGAFKYTILQDTGRLAASITPDHGDGFVQAWTNVKYAKFHISSAPRKKIPLRDFFAIDQAEWVDEAADTIIAALLGRI